jgi:hypothetical protein
VKKEKIEEMRIWKCWWMNRGEASSTLLASFSQSSRRLLLLFLVRVLALAAAETNYRSS